MKSILILSLFVALALGFTCPSGLIYGSDCFPSDGSGCCVFCGPTGGYGTCNAAAQTDLNSCVNSYTNNANCLYAGSGAFCACSTSLTTGQKIGVGIGVSLGIIFCCGCIGGAIYWCTKRRRHHHHGGTAYVSVGTPIYQPQPIYQAPPTYAPQQGY